MSLDATLYESQRLRKIKSNDFNSNDNEETNESKEITESTETTESNKKKAQIFDVLMHPMRKYYPMPDLNPFDINIQLNGQKFSDWTQFFIGSDKNEDKSIYITSTNEGGVITLRDSYLYTLMSDKENDATVESCQKFYCNKPRCYEITKQCSKYPTVLPNKVFVDHKYMTSTCKCSEIDGLMPIKKGDADDEDPKYWMVHFMENKKLNDRNKSKKCDKKRSSEEIELETGIDQFSSKLSNLDNQRDQIKKDYESLKKSFEVKMKKIWEDFKKENPINVELPSNLKDKTETKVINNGIVINYNKLKKEPEYRYDIYRDIIDKKADNYYKNKYKKVFEDYKKLLQPEVTIPKYSRPPTPATAPPMHQSVPPTAPPAPPAPMAQSLPQPSYIGGGTLPEELSDLFGKWSTNLKNKQNTNNTYYVPIEYLDTKTGKKLEIEDILIDPVHSKIKVEGIPKAIKFSAEKLKEIVELYIEEMRNQENKINSAQEDEKLRNTLSYEDYLQYKKTNNISNYSESDEIIGTYDSIDDGNKQIEQNQSGGGRKFVNINGERVILKIGKDEKYITKDGNLVSVKEYKDKGNYVELMTLNGEPMKIRSNNKDYYLQKDGKLIRCKS
tara:strand:- start:1009 stop:2850 length:1842 start_codon:yes stop_codon:yes gene_type:complete